MTSRDITEQIHKLSERIILLDEVKELVVQTLIDAGLDIFSYDLLSNKDRVYININHTNSYSLNDEQRHELDRELRFLDANLISDSTYVGIDIVE